jgi:ABC-2 type transport system permease protein
MRPQRSWAFAKQDLRLVRRDPVPFVALVLMPLVLIVFLRPMVKASLISAGHPGANGSEQAVPGMAVMFSAFLVGQVGFNLFREHGWRTWDRMRASSATSLEMMAGKTVTPLLLIATQLALLFGIGAVVFGLRVQGTWTAIAVVGATLATCLVALGFAVAALCRTSDQVIMVGNVGSMLLAGLGGALAPIALLPEWARHVAPAMPTYWAMKGFQQAIFDSAGASHVAVSAVVLLVFAAGFAVFAMVRFRLDDAKAFRS